MALSDADVQKQVNFARDDGEIKLNIGELEKK